jgi:hypothetical protein
MYQNHIHPAGASPLLLGQSILTPRVIEGNWHRMRTWFSTFLKKTMLRWKQGIGREKGHHIKIIFISSLKKQFCFLAENDGTIMLR